MKVIASNRKTDLEVFRCGNLNWKTRTLFVFVFIFSNYKRKIHLLEKICTKKNQKRQKNTIAPGQYPSSIFSQCIFYSSNHLLIHLVNNFFGTYVSGTMLGSVFLGRHW